MELSSCREESRSHVVTHRRRARQRGEKSYSSGMCHGDNLKNVLKRSLSGRSASVFYQSPTYNGLKHQSLVWLIAMQLGPGSMWAAYLSQKVLLGLCWWQTIWVSHFIDSQYLHLVISSKLDLGFFPLLCGSVSWPGGTVQDNIPRESDANILLLNLCWELWTPRSWISCKQCVMLAAALSTRRSGVSDGRGVVSGGFGWAVAIS